jgi:DNA/RNA-binding domain of Phe-tRNA-synthetase-like protein
MVFSVGWGSEGVAILPVSSVPITLDDHPTLDAASFTTTFPRALAEMTTPESLLALLRAGAAAPMASSDEVRKLVRDLLRHGGYKPTGRGKPASEYLIGASAEGSLGSINLAVDACNAVSLHSGLPISVVDLDLARAPFRIGIAKESESYVFNASGQTIDLAGLLCLFDADGPCANAVKDSQRTKTHAGTRRTLSVVWGTRALSGRTGVAVAWYRDLLRQSDALTSESKDRS